MYEHIFQHYVTFLQNGSSRAMTHHHNPGWWVMTHHSISRGWQVWWLVLYQKLPLPLLPVVFGRSEMPSSILVWNLGYRSDQVSSGVFHVVLDHKKAFEKSRMIRSCWYPTSNDGNNSWASVKSWVSQLRLALNPCWQSVKIWWASS